MPPNHKKKSLKEAPEIQIKTDRKLADILVKAIVKVKIYGILQLCIQANFC